MFFSFSTPSSRVTFPQPNIWEKLTTFFWHPPGIKKIHFHPFSWYPYSNWFFNDSVTTWHPTCNSRVHWEHLVKLCVSNHHHLSVLDLLFRQEKVTNFHRKWNKLINLTKVYIRRQPLPQNKIVYKQHHNSFIWTESNVLKLKLTKISKKNNFFFKLGFQ